MKLIIVLSWAAAALAFPIANPVPLPFPQGGVSDGSGPTYSRGDGSNANQGSSKGSSNNNGGNNGRPGHNQGKGGGSGR
ncbi:hypothetical protein EG328_011969 [Venturia inaequalis]|uniref:Uncharacterized protein n=1 Tax=Venturia inaequalis TaxID=5025 RepID=A0A8H3YMA5_VENIN|nr:hypothetical protein EG328_011969 [Venturia inaequalis]KAE9968201.1 hypothetical protein EG327_011139 [Venturia inaequalis]